MFEYVSLFGAYSSTFAADTTLLGGIVAADESYFAITSTAANAPFPNSAENPGSDAIKAVTSFRILEETVWSATFSALRPTASPSIPPLAPPARSPPLDS